MEAMSRIAEKLSPIPIDADMVDILYQYKIKIS